MINLVGRNRLPVDRYPGHHWHLAGEPREPSEALQVGRSEADVIPTKVVSQTPNAPPTGAAALAYREKPGMAQASVQVRVSGPEGMRTPLRRVGDS